MSLSSAVTDSLARQRAIQARCFHPSHTFVAFPKEAIEQSIPERFEQQVRRHPERLAIKSRSHAFTYTELNEAANRLAHAILAERGPREEPVALLFEPGAPVIAAILGVLKAGKIYAPLDPADPRGRIDFMLEDLGAGLIVTNRRNLSVAREWEQTGRAVINVDEIDPHVPSANPGLSLSPDTAAYILYTSGSTGQPKGVVQNHRNLLFEVLRLANSYHVCPHDRFLLLHSCSFSASVRQIFPALLNGAAVCPLDLKTEGVGQVPHWLAEAGITITNGTHLLRECVGALTGADQFPHLRIITMGGDTVYKRDVELYQRYLSPDAVMVVRMPATETDTMRQLFVDKETAIADNIVPVGYPVEGAEVLLLDEEGREVGVDAVGEIAVKSRYLSPGYWRRPDLTQAAFRPDPGGGPARIYHTGDLGRMAPDGCLTHLGRKDLQVKVQGYRIEIPEVETALLDLDTIERAAVVVREDRPGQKRLVAYLIPARQPAPTVSALRRALAARLPGYMVPAAFVMLEAFPLTSRGKVDQEALPPPDRERPELDQPFAAPRTAIEEVLAQTWEDILDLEGVGIHDSFFDLGGQSLLATQMLSRVQETFRCEVPLRVLFDAPTVAALADTLVAREPEPGWTERMARVRQRVDGMSAVEVRAALQQRQGER